MLHYSYYNCITLYVVEAPGCRAAGFDRVPFQDSFAGSRGLGFRVL